MDSNPTMGEAPSLVDRPTVNPLDLMGSGPVWLTDMLAIRYMYRADNSCNSWVDVSQPKVEEPLGMYLDPGHKPFPAKRTRPLVGKLRRRKV